MTTMPRFFIALALIAALVLAPVSASAQGIPVFDIKNLAEIVKIVKQVQATLTLVREEYTTVQRIGRGFGGDLGRYRVPAIPTSDHDVSRWLFAGPLLQGLNTGDPRGELYLQVMRRVDKPGTLFNALDPATRKMLEATFATLEIYDSTSTLGVHQAAMSRTYGDRIGALITTLEADITNPGSEYHQATAIADNLSVAALITARQNQSANQTDSSILEQLVARNKRTRDGAAATNNMVITALTDKGAMSKTLVGSATDTIQNWRLP